MRGCGCCFFPRARVPVWYWARLAFGLFTSVIGTAVTLPERLVLAPLLWIAGRESALRLSHPAVVIPGVLPVWARHTCTICSRATPGCGRRCGARRSHPRVLPELVVPAHLHDPFVSAKRPQDDVAIGPEWPAEDDFAVNNWTCASSLMGRFVLPRRHAYYDRFHSLEGLTERERRRWRRTLWAFCRKLTWLCRGRTLLLKTPSHTARVRALLELFGDGVKFVHISRDPAAVVESNVKMASRLSVFNLQPPCAEEDLRAHIQAEFAESEGDTGKTPRRWGRAESRRSVPGPGRGPDA
jgi:hypothetical protein